MIVQVSPTYRPFASSHSPSSIMIGYDLPDVHVSLGGKDAATRRLERLPTEGRAIPLFVRLCGSAGSSLWLAALSLCSRNSNMFKANVSTTATPVKKTSSFLKLLIATELRSRVGRKGDGVCFFLLESLERGAFASARSRNSEAARHQYSPSYRPSHKAPAGDSS